MHNLRYMTFDATQALLVVGLGIAVIGALHAFESLAARHVRERTQRALESARKHASGQDRNVT